MQENSTGKLATDLHGMLGEEERPSLEKAIRLALDEKIVVTRYLVQSAGTIARARPSLRARIVDRLLGIDETHHKHKDLIKGDAIQSFETFFEEVDNKEEILAFVQDQLECSSPRTRKAAKAFLDKYGQ
jgi:hypothetical protein